jgi:alpha-ketoglutaric semialdehyde dehydrogenase
MPDLQPVLIAGAWVASTNPSGSSQSTNPSTRERLPFHYPISGRADVDRVLAAAADAAPKLRATPPETIARFLERFADSIESNRESLVSAAHQETGYPTEPRLNSVELPRTANQLRTAARAARDRSWCRPTIDTASGIRSQFEPLPGAVLVFGPNNFPFAFNAVAGGDFAAAIAARCPVIAKVHASHPRTSQLLAELAQQSAVECGLPSGTVQILYRLDHSETHRMIGDPAVAAVGFTGSRHAGLAIKATADAHGKPSYLEMSSVNPVFVLPGALAERSDAIAAEFFTSCTMGAGQFCTNPGLVVVPDTQAGDAFIASAVSSFAASNPGVLLNQAGLDSLVAAIDTLVNAGAKVLTGGKLSELPGIRYENTLLTVDADHFLANPETFQTEAFGPCSLIVRTPLELLPPVTASFEGNLTGCIYSAGDGSDDTLYDTIAPILRTKVGRLLNDKMPTGVAVSPAMNHGGPYPATGHPHFTSVGIPAAITRFAQLACYDNVRPHRLPAELADGNPLGLQRCVDGEWTR